MRDCTTKSEYFLLRARQIDFASVYFTGKYSFQYIEDAVFTDCRFDTKDAFWHAKNVTVRNSVLKGEYLAWYSDGLTLENCRIIGTQPFCYWNTCAQVLPQVAGQLLVGAPAAWALAKWKSRGCRFLRGLYIALMLLPFQVTMVPSYLTLNALGLMDTVWAIILPGVFSTFPVFIMQRGFEAVPQPLLEAAAIDGASPWQQFWRIGLPVGMPGVLSALTIGFLDAWNALEQPMIFLKTPSLWPLSLYLTNGVGEDLALTMAASLVMLIPAVLIFSFGQKYLEQGILAGAVKG